MFQKLHLQQTRMLVGLSIAETFLLLLLHRCLTSILNMDIERPKSGTLGKMFN
jgi:hypothetical protein